jgi:hypothetical protein
LVNFWLIGYDFVMKIIIIAIFFVSLLIAVPAFAATPKTPVLGKAEIVSPTEIKWHFESRDKTAIAFELWNVITRNVVLKVDDPKATFIDEKNVVPADPDMACGRYVVAVNAEGERSFAQILTYPCVRTPPVAPPPPVIETKDNKIIKVNVSSGANDPATSIGVYEAKRGVWLSPENLFVADPFMEPVGNWGADMGSLLIGLRPNSSYMFYSRARSVTGELSKLSTPVAVRMPMEAADANAPVLDRIGELNNLRKQNFEQTFVTKSAAPVIAGFFRGSGVTVDLDDRPHQATVAGSGEVKSFSFAPGKIGSGFHYLRLGAVSEGAVYWTPTVEFYIQGK